MKLVTSNEMRALDRKAIEEFGIPGVVLMENAALGVVRALKEKYRHLLSRRVFIFCGKGNNGGDGLAIARHLANSGHDTRIILLASPDRLSGDAAANLGIVREMGIPIETIVSAEGLGPLRELISGNGLLIDAIFGTGLNSAVTGFYSDIISLINDLPNPVVSIDVPSGINADCGRVDGVCVRADVTVTFALPRRAHFLTPASNFAGRLEVVEISIPTRLMEEIEVEVETIEGPDIAALFSVRESDSHKGDYGHLVVIGGSEGKGGAPAMAGLSALRMGTGLVTLTVPQGVNRSIELNPLETMSYPLPETEDGFIAERAFEKLKTFLKGKDALIAGPGIGTDPETGRLLKKILGAVSVPVLIDADGLNLLARDKTILEGRRCPVILTPHPGEMGRLTGISAREVQESRLESAMDFAGKSDCVVVLKGAGTIIAVPRGKAWVNTTGNSGMATAGTGDVLSGIIGGLLAQGLSPEEAARAGVFLHGRAGDNAKEEKGERSLIAGDLIDALPRTLREA